MSEAHDIVTQNKGLQFKTTMEVIAVYIVGFITFLTFFDQFNLALYSLLGFASLLAFFTIMFAMVGYIVYNFYVIASTYISR